MATTAPIGTTTTTSSSSSSTTTTTTSPAKKTNPLDVFCPKPSCRCKILRAGAAFVSDIAYNDVESPSSSSSSSSSSWNSSSLPPLPPLPEGSHPTASQPPLPEIQALLDYHAGQGQVQQQRWWWWQVNDMMHFENVAFSHALPGGHRVLACADCELGPLGVQPAGQQVFLIAADRVRYAL
ncbi:hypothetical protein DFJ73DRAFT_763362 [Zopfochytrium polystomum]|nr:hypothetical protein DFJ73DRAFT_763362 [Zopfochytrium polystomum]